ncbi:MAG: hypothetical protein GY943_18450 [Chloroflexi bacterium]|nr:hypothetical protein [Chloroflexota bacterium]
MAVPIDDNLIPKTTLNTRTKIILSIIGLLFAILFLFLLFPTNNASFPSWVPDLQTRIWTIFEFLAPYIVVGLLGGGVGLAELSATFQTYPREALRTRWAWILILVNLLTAVLALMIVQATMPAVNLVLQVIGVGIGFQAIIRTKFVLARPMSGSGDGEAGEVSVNLGWLYDQFQNLCRTQIDLELMNNRRTAVTRMIKYYPTLAELYDIAWYTIIARATLSEDEEKKRLEKLEKLIDPKAPENFAKTSIALMILENGGQAYVELLLNQAGTEAEIEAITPAKQSAEKMVRYMVDHYSLEQLVHMSKDLTENPEILRWINEASRPAPETSEANQKAAIAHFMVQQIGSERISETMQTIPSVESS